MSNKDKKLTRKDAAQLYQDLQKTMMKMKSDGASSKSPIDSKVAKQIAEAIRAGMKKDDALKGASIEDLAAEEQSIPFPSPLKSEVKQNNISRGTLGAQWAVSVMVLAVLSKITLSLLEVTGIIKVDHAYATLSHRAEMIKPIQVGEQYTPEEVALLKSLDQVRLQLEDKKNKLEKREQDIEKKENVLVIKLAELRDLTEKLKNEREKDIGKRNNQLDQLANVYGSMNPTEAAQLIEQLDATIALKLLERMPEKRIGQILALMSSERALTITRMLSGQGRIGELTSKSSGSK